MFVITFALYNARKNGSANVMYPRAASMMGRVSAATIHAYVGLRHANRPKLALHHRANAAVMVSS